MAALVLDASLAASWCFPDERSEYTHAILQAVSKPRLAIAPQLWAYEVRNSILMGGRRKRIALSDAKEFFLSLRVLPIRLTDSPSYDGLFDLAERHGLTVYDAAYLDLAIRELLPLASLDKKLIRVAQEHGVKLFQPLT